jgi:hypothetical protein
VLRVPRATAQFLLRAKGGAGFIGGIGTAVRAGTIGSREGFMGEVIKGEDMEGILGEEARVGGRGLR